MGMFDFLKCQAPLPEPGWEGRVFQSKDTPSQMMDQYQIREDGTLWHENYDIEDRSDPHAEGIDRIAGIMTQVNKRWEACSDFTGEIRFYDTQTLSPRKGWIEFSAYFVNGKLSHDIVLARKDDPNES